MTIQQISVFLENKFGRLHEILSLIANDEIRIIAATVSDTSEFGILRLVTTDPHKTFQILKNHQISSNISEVFAIVTDRNSGQITQTIEHFTQAGLSIEYMYCFSTSKAGFLILRTNNLEAARNVIRRASLVCVDQAHIADL
ncbi:MAG: acetolactate synthase [Dysgonamonadaceae bacterium]|jgi:hypothetical protein|nr:acetolactate synthase [Dysgonamonadaceae bacterium]